MSLNPEQWWLCIDYDANFAEEPCLAVWVQVGDGEGGSRSAGLAADIALPIMNEESERTNLTSHPQEPVHNVYVVGPLDRVQGRQAFNVVERCEPSPLQCCGGLPPETPERHAAGCPVIVDAEVVAEEPPPG